MKKYLFLPVFLLISIFTFNNVFSDVREIRRRGILLTNNTGNDIKVLFNRIKRFNWSGFVPAGEKIHYDDSRSCYDISIKVYPKGTFSRVKLNKDRGESYRKGGDDFLDTAMFDGEGKRIFKEKTGTEIKCKWNRINYVTIRRNINTNAIEMSIAALQ